MGPKQAPQAPAWLENKALKNQGPKSDAPSWSNFPLFWEEFDVLWPQNLKHYNLNLNQLKLKVRLKGECNP